MCSIVRANYSLSIRGGLFVFSSGHSQSSQTFDGLRNFDNSIASPTIEERRDEAQGLIVQKMAGMSYGMEIGEAWGYPDIWAAGGNAEARKLAALKCVLERMGPSLESIC